MLDQDDNGALVPISAYGITNGSNITLRIVVSGAGVRLLLLGLKTMHLGKAPLQLPITLHLHIWCPVAGQVQTVRC